MSQRSRLHRPEPERTGPFRNFQHITRGPETSDRRPPGPAPDPETDGWGEVVDYGVALAYSVVEEQIREGQRVAAQFSARGNGRGGAAPADARRLAQRLLHSYSDLGSLWLELLESLAQSPDLVSEGLRMWRGAPTADRAPAAAAANVAIEIDAPRPAQVDVDLRGDYGGQAVAVQPLAALDPDKPPLRDVRLEAPSNGARPRLCIRIPEDQPPDTYTGVLIDIAEHAPLGTVSVRLA